MDPTTVELDRLEGKIEELKREYDLFLAGNRRGEPSSLRSQLERDVLRLSRAAFTSTASRFRMKTLAHRFQAVESQMRKIVEHRDRRRQGQENRSPEEANVVLDRAALDRPQAVEPHLKRIYEAVCASLDGRKAPNFETLKQRMIAEATRYLSNPGVRGVRFSVVPGDSGPKLRGEVLRDSTGRSPERKGESQDAANKAHS